VVRIATRLVLHEWGRFAVTVAGVSFAVMLVMVQSGLFVGLLDNATITIEKARADVWIAAKNTPNIDFAHGFPDTYVQRVRTVEGVEEAANLLLSFMVVTLPTGVQENVLLYAIEDPVKWNLPWDIEAGDVDDLRRSDSLFLDSSARSRFGAFALGDHYEINHRRYRIVGVTRGAMSFSTTPIAFMDLSRAQHLHPDMNGLTAYILVKLRDGANVETVMAEIRRRLPYSDVHARNEWMTRTTDYWVKSTGLGLNMAVTILLGCLIGVVVVALTLYGSAMQHLKEFGMIKAIGGPNAEIYAILLREGAMAGLAGFAIGAALSYAACPLLELLDLKVIMSIRMAAWVLGGTVLLCCAAATLPFRRIAAIDPAFVFRS
jgi:putative ABC transport system permease protein